MRDSEQRKKSAEDRRLGQLLSQAAPSARLDWGAVQAEAEKRRRRRLAARSVFSLAAALLLVMGGWAFWQEFLVAEDVVVITDDVVGDDSGAASERDTPPTTVAISEDSSWEITQISDNPGMGMVPWLDGHYLAWRSHDGHDWEILVVNLEEGTEQNLTDDEQDQWEPRMSGDWIVWQEGDSGGPYRLWAYNHVSGEGRELGRLDWYGQYVIAGDLVVWPDYSRPKVGFKVHSFSAGETREVELGEYEEVWPTTDGVHVGVQAVDSRGDGDLFLYEWQTGSLEIIAPSARGLALGSWMEDNWVADGRVVWSMLEGRNREIFLYDSKTGRREQLTDNEVDDVAPVLGGPTLVWYQMQGEAYDPIGPPSPNRSVQMRDLSTGETFVLPGAFAWLQQGGGLVATASWPQKWSEMYLYQVESGRLERIAREGKVGSWIQLAGGRATWYWEDADPEGPTAEVMLARPVIPGAAAGSQPWRPLDEPPELAGVEAVPPGFAVQVRASTSGSAGEENEALVIPETESYRLQRTDHGPGGSEPFSTLEVRTLEGVLTYSEGIGVRRGQPMGPGESADGLEWAFQQVVGPDHLPGARWERSGNRYRAEATLRPPPSAEVPEDATAEVTLEVLVDEGTRIPLYSRLAVRDRGGAEQVTEVQRRLIPLAAITDPPSLDDVREFAAKRWRSEIEAARALPYQAVGLDYPGLRLNVIRATAANWLRLEYGLPDKPVTAVIIEHFPAADPEAGKELERWEEPTYDEGSLVTAFRRGDAVVRLTLVDGSTMGLPEDPFAHLGLSLDKVKDALVPLDQLPPSHFDPPEGWQEN